MTEENINSEGIEGEDFVIITPEKNTTNVLPWNLRLTNRSKHTIRIDFRHSNLMVKWLIIGDIEEASDEGAFKEQKIRGRIGEEI